MPTLSQNHPKSPKIARPLPLPVGRPFLLPLLLASLLLPLPARAQATSPATQNHPKSPKVATLAVLPFAAQTPAEKKLAEQMRFAVSQKISRSKTLDRRDNVEVDQTLSALEIPAHTTPDDTQLPQLLTTLDTDFTILGTVSKRTLTLTLYQGQTEKKSASVEIPGERDSPKLAVEKILTDLLALQFTHIREDEVDRSDPATEKRWATRPNLAPNPSFEQGKTTADAWGAILRDQRYAPPVLTADEAAKLPKDRVAVVPTSLAGDPAHNDGRCLLLRMSKNVAETNGLACESTWIPVDHGSKYRFSAHYRSTGPVPRLFIKGFATRPDQYGSKDDPEATRREAYRAQIIPREANKTFEPIEMDFTPSATKEDLKIQWIRIDLFIYLKPGDVYFDNITVKKISE